MNLNGMHRSLLLSTIM